jgi:hypothetical protein
MGRRGIAAHDVLEADLVRAKQANKRVPRLGWRLPTDTEEDAAQPGDTCRYQHQFMAANLLDTDPLCLGTGEEDPSRIVRIQVLAHLGDPAIADHEDPAVVVVVRVPFALRAVTCHSSAIVSPSAIIAPNSKRWLPASKRFR